MLKKICILLSTLLVIAGLYLLCISVRSVIVIENNGPAFDKAELMIGSKLITIGLIAANSKVTFIVPINLVGSRFNYSDNFAHHGRYLSGPTKFDKQIKIILDNSYSPDIQRLTFWENVVAF